MGLPEPGQAEGAPREAEVGGFRTTSMIRYRMSAPDAYHRVTDPERFRPLHGAVLELASELRRRFVVEVHEGSALDCQFQDVGIERTGLRLVPASAGAAPLDFAFTSFPGVAVGFGIAGVDVFPCCGCDACAETLEGELERLRELIEDVTAGRLAEVIRGGDSRRWRWERWSGESRTRGGSPVTRRVERRPRWWVRSRIQWKPWRGAAADPLVS
jgi:hypothetical protein